MSDVKEGAASAAASGGDNAKAINRIESTAGRLPGPRSGAGLQACPCETLDDWGRDKNTEESAAGVRVLRRLKSSVAWATGKAAREKAVETASYGTTSPFNRPLKGRSICNPSPVNRAERGLPSTPLFLLLAPFITSG